MSSNELGEVSELFIPHRGASSTTPQKRNPISSEVVLADSKILRSNAGLVLDGMVSDFERASGPWHLEWVAIPKSFGIAVGTLAQTDMALSGLVANTKAVLDNLHSTKGLIVAEAVILGLARATERADGQERWTGTMHMILSTLPAKNVFEKDVSLLDAMSQMKEVMKYLSRSELESLCDETNYLGACPEMVESVFSRST